MSKSKPKPQVTSDFEAPKSEIRKELSSIPKMVVAPSNLLFNNSNYLWMGIGLGVILLGYLLMMGVNNNVQGGVYPAEEIYSFRRTILSPFVIILGFIIEIYAIIKLKKG